MRTDKGIELYPANHQFPFPAEVPLHRDSGFAGITVLGEAERGASISLDKQAFKAGLVATPEEIDMLFGSEQHRPSGFAIGLHIIKALEQLTEREQSFLPFVPAEKRRALGCLAAQLYVGDKPPNYLLESPSAVWYNLPPDALYVQGICRAESEGGREWPLALLFVLESIAAQAYPSRRRVLATTAPWNHRSIRPFTKAGYRAAHVLDDAFYPGSPGRPADAQLRLLFTRHLAEPRPRADEPPTESKTSIECKLELPTSSAGSRNQKLIEQVWKTINRDHLALVDIELVPEDTRQAIGHFAAKNHLDEANPLLPRPKA